MSLNIYYEENSVAGLDPQLYRLNDSVAGAFV